MEAPGACALVDAMFKLPSKLDGLLRYGHMLPKGAQDEIPLIKQDLEKMMAILQDHGNSSAEDRAMVIECLRKEVRELSYDMDDCIDEYEHAAGSRSGSGFRIPRRRNKITRLRSKTTRLPEKLKRRLWMANKIREFSVRSQEALQRYGLFNPGGISTASTRNDASFGPWHPTLYRERADDLVGIDAPMNKLQEWLANDGDQKLRVVSIVGPGGVGKTTLANKLYGRIGGQFECRAFVRTSQKSDMRRLLISMLSQVQPQQRSHTWKVHSLIADIRTHLRDKRYLIVIDGIWATSTWDIVNCALPDGNLCSRILITTEVEDVALKCCGYDTKYVFKMKSLGEDDSRKLFLNTVVVPPEFNEVSDSIMRKCGGLPLATVTIGSLLASRMGKPERWDYVNKSLGYGLGTNPTLEGMKQVFNLSYNNLPQHLKACMLYLSIYQEDYIILKDDLVKQWISEGFICAAEEEEEEEISRSYFDELISSRMIQPVHINDNDEVLSCTVPHMVLNFITHKSIEENFITAVDYSQTTARLTDKVRRLSLHFGNAEDATPPTNMRLSQVRTLAFFGVFKCVPSIVEFRLLQVLILHFWGDEERISFDLTRMEELFRLRYLQVTCNVILEVRQTKMRGLQYLETLKIDARASIVPSHIVHLPSLLHLNLPAETNLPNGIGHMTSLRTLGCFDLSWNSIENVESLGELTNLRDLQLTCYTVQFDNLKNNIQCLASILGRLSNLESLTLVPVGSSYVTSMSISCDGLSTVSSPPALLRRLEWSPRICTFSSLPKWIGHLGKLCILKVGVRELARHDVDVLRGLPALTVLSLYVRTKPAESIVFDKAGFSVLKYFKFRCSVPCLKFEADAMPNLQKLKLGFDAHGVDQCGTIPVGIENLSGLKEIFAKIGGSSADEPYRKFAESALNEASKMHLGLPTVNIQFVDRIFGGKDAKRSGTQEEEHTTLQKLRDHGGRLKRTEWSPSKGVQASNEDADRFSTLSEWHIALDNKLDAHRDDKLEHTILVNEVANKQVDIRPPPLNFSKEPRAIKKPTSSWRRPPPLNVSKEPRAIKKPRVESQAESQPPHDTPKVIHIKPSEFRSVVAAIEDLPGSISTPSPVRESCASSPVPAVRHPMWSTQVRVLADGFSWRKYGQKEILGAKHPRCYYRCVHRNWQGCSASKQVQRTDGDPWLFDVRYQGNHTCAQSKHFLPQAEQEQSSVSVGVTASPFIPFISPATSESQVTCEAVSGSTARVQPMSPAASESHVTYETVSGFGDTSKQAESRTLMPLESTSRLQNPGSSVSGPGMPLPSNISTKKQTVPSLQSTSSKSLRAVKNLQLLREDPATKSATVGLWGMKAAGWVASSIISEIFKKGYDYLGIDVKRLNELEPKVLLLERVTEVVEKSPDRPRLEQLFEDLKSAFYEVEDILDDIEYHHLEKQIQDGNREPFVPKSSPLKNKLKESLDKIETVINDAYKILEGLNLPSVSNDNRSQAVAANSRGSVTTAAPPPVVIGRDEECEKIIAMLHDKEGDGQSLCYSVIGIHGIGGSGKSTLAQLACAREKNDSHFDLVMWVYVSQDFSVPNIFSQMIEEATGEPSSEFGSPYTLEWNLRRNLHGKRFLLVLDDVWNNIKDRRQELLSPLRVGKAGSKILVTSRTQEGLLAVGAPKQRCIPISELDEDVFLKLFMHYVGAMSDDGIQKLFESAGAEIAKMLRKSPLAASTVGPLLGANPRLDFWKTTQNCAPLNEMMGALWWSYKHLDEHVRRCFAFCSIFPRRHGLKRDELVHLWVAEGFIKNSTNAWEEMEDVGQGYFNELVSASFLKPGGWGKEYYVVHDLLHDLAEKVAGSDCFRIKKGWTGEVPPDVRHLYIEDFDRMLAEKDLGGGNVRTLLIERGRNITLKDTRVLEKSFEGMLKRLPKLRVLTVRAHWTYDESIEPHIFPASIGQLKHLRYLAFPARYSIILPGTFAKLYHMQVLHFGVRSEDVLGEVDINPGNLRYIVSLKCAAFPNIGRLTSLQTLPRFTVKKGQGYELKQLRDLNKLRGTLELRGLDYVESKEEALEAKLAAKEGLTELVLAWDSIRRFYHQGGNPEVQAEVLEGLCPPMGLQRLEIKYYEGSRYPNWMVDKQNGGPEDLHELVLHKCEQLEATPALFQVFTGLRSLSLSFCIGWNAFPDNIGDLTKLEKLNIRGCPEMRSLPDLPLSLKYFELELCNREFVESCVTTGDPNWEKIQHIPNKRIAGREYSTDPLVQQQLAKGKKKQGMSW